MTQVKCRTCLEKANLNSSCSISQEFLLGKSFKDVLLMFVPQMITVTEVDEVLCVNCSEHLKAFARFIRRCITVEEVLKNAKAQEEETTQNENNRYLPDNEYLPSSPCNETGSNMEESIQDLQEHSGHSSAYPCTSETDNQITIKEEVVEWSDTQELTLLRVQPLFKVNKFRETYSQFKSEIYFQDDPAAEPSEFPEQVPQQAEQSIVEERKCDSCGVTLSTDNSWKVATKCSNCLDGDDTQPHIIDISSDSSFEYDNDGLAPICEEEETAEKDDSDIIMQFEIMEDEQFDIQDDSQNSSPVGYHDRVISVAHIDEILSAAKESNIDIHDYSTSEEKRILFFGSVIAECPICKIKLKDGQNLKKHLRDVHNNELDESKNDCTPTLTKDEKKQAPEVTCPICKINVHTTTLLTKHLSMAHENYKPYKCEKCGRSFRMKYTFANHVKKYEKFDSCDFRKCYFCSEMVSRENYASHSKTHTKSFVCNVCGLGFLAAHHLELHSIKHKNTKKGTRGQLCPKCGKMTKHLDVHIKTHEPTNKTYMCHKCPKFFLTQSYLNKHIAYVHQDEKKFQCSDCDMSYSSSSSLSYHHKLKHAKVYPYTCETCGQGFSRADSYHRHINNHPAEGKRVTRRKYRYSSDKTSGPVKCKYCSKLYATIYKLRVHLLTHIKEMRYKCQICPLSFASHSNKHRHEQRHKNPYFEFSCEICWKRLETKEELEKHVIKHERSKKYKCQICDESYARQYLLNHHISEKHTDIEELEKKKEAVLTDALEEFLL